MYIFECEGYYVYDLGGQIYAKDKCLVTDEVKKVMNKALKILSENPDLDIDVEDAECYTRSWSYREISDMWSFSKVKPAEEATCKKILSVNSFEYDISDTVAAIYYAFKNKFNDKDKKILKEVFDVHIEEPKEKEDEDDEPGGMTVGKLKKILDRYNNNTLVVDIDELFEEFN